MNSLVSYEWLKEYVDLTGETPESFASRISLSGPAVERVYPQGVDFDKIVVGRIRSIEPHPNADRQRITLVDIGLMCRSKSCAEVRISFKINGLPLRGSAQRSIGMETQRSRK